MTMLTEDQKKEHMRVEKHKIIAFFLLWMIQSVAVVFLYPWDVSNPDDWFLCAMIIFVTAITSWYWSEPVVEIVRSSKKKQNTQMSEVFFFNDLMKDDGEPGPNIRASISFLSTEEGGRKSWVQSGYKPNHNFGLPDGREFYVGEIAFDSEQKIYPGETCEATVRFIPGPGLREKLQPGQTWRIQEGGKLVAIGRVLEVIH